MGPKDLFFSFLLETQAHMGLFREIHWDQGVLRKKGLSILGLFFEHSWVQRTNDKCLTMLSMRARERRIPNQLGPQLPH